ncbi:hypothetical protein JCGZ_19985 [Jatropha curcas]|uniref:Aminotransferase-like plant mobile domain-containing protein n=1 Tax=Jatropha curcas TaxID=180498 RepID=A0A067LK79_JATCU|nr:hypothetical protein JCGZ_19985 [Jatropha curcas]
MNGYNTLVDPVCHFGQLDFEMILLEVVLWTVPSLKGFENLPWGTYGSITAFVKRMSHIMIEKYPWGDAADFLDFVQVAVVYQHRCLLILGLFYDMYYLRERVYEWELGPDRRRVSRDSPNYMLSTRSIRLEQNIAAARRGTVATDHLAALLPDAYAVFVRTQLLVHIPPPTEFDPFTEGGGQQQQHGKHVRRGFEPKDLDTTIVVGMLEHRPGASFSFILDCTGQTTQGMLETHPVSSYRMSPPGYTHIYPLFEEFSIISGRIPVVEEILALSQLDIDPASLILLVFNFSVQYLPLSGIDGYCNLRLVPIVEQMARRRTPFPLILAETFSWLGEHDWDPNSVLGPMRSPLLLQCRLIDETVEDCAAIFQGLTSEGVRWTCPWWYMERVTVSSYMLCVPLYGLTMVVAYYPSRVARQYSCHQIIPIYTRFEGGLITQ